MDGAFAHLAGIHMLSMSGCSQATITDASSARLRAAGIPVMRMYRSPAPSLVGTGGGLVELAGGMRRLGV